MPTYVYHHCPKCKKMILNSPNWHLGIGPPIVQCTTQNCGQWVRVKGANEWKFFGWPDKAILVSMYGLSYLFQGVGAGGFVAIAWSYFKSEEVKTEPLLICVVIGGIISAFFLWFNLRKEIAESDKRLENPRYREMVEHAKTP